MKFQLGASTVNVCSVLLLTEMGERDIYDDRTPACARSFSSFKEKLRALVRKLARENTGYTYYNTGERINVNKNYVRDQFKTVICFLTEKQEKAEGFLTELGFKKSGPFTRGVWELGSEKNEDDPDLSVFTISCADFLDGIEFYKLEEKAA